MSRSRRPILLAVCAVAMICLWQYRSPGYVHHEHSLSISSTLDRRSQRYNNIGSSEQGSVGRIAVKDTSHRRGAEDILLAEDDLHGARYIAPKEDSLHDDHPEDQYDEMMAAHESYERDEHILEQKATDKKDALAEEDTSTDKAKETEEEHNPDNILDTPGEVFLGETVKAPQGQKNGKEGVIASPRMNPKPDTKPIEKEPEGQLSLEGKGDTLPEVIHIPLEDAVAETKLAGWEDEWVAHASFDVKKWGFLEEPKIDFVYLWVNGSDKAFQNSIRSYEENSILNDPEGVWIKSHGTNRYRDWDELKYSLRSLEAHTSGFRNQVQILVNSVEDTKDKKQIPVWLNDKLSIESGIQVLTQEDFFDIDKRACLPTFNSLTIENQIFNVSPSSFANTYQEANILSAMYWQA